MFSNPRDDHHALRFAKMWTPNHPPYLFSCSPTFPYAECYTLLACKEDGFAITTDQRGCYWFGPIGSRYLRHSGPSCHIPRYPCKPCTQVPCKPLVWNRILSPNLLRPPYRYGAHAENWGLTLYISASYSVLVNQQHN